MPSAELARAGYDFKGWCTTSDGKGTTYAAGSTAKDLTAENGATVTLYAKWVLAGNWSISYELNGGTNDESNPAEYNIESAVTLADPERSFYEFAGWYSNADFSGEKVEGWNAGGKTGDIALYAKWNLPAVNVASIIKSLSYGEYNIVAVGPITNDTISAIKAALQKNRTAKFSLDFSQTTGLTSIGDYAFNNCSNLTSVNIPDGVTSIGTQAFCECKSLTNVNIPNSVAKISSQAFDNCTSLTRVNIPNGVESIGAQAFSFCTSLTSVSIPASVTSIGENVFNGCDKLTTVKYGGKKTKWDALNVSLPTDATVECTEE